MTLEALMDGGDTLPMRRSLAARAAGQETLISDSANGQVHFLNAAAALVWECCDGRTTLSDCVRCLRETFAVPPDTDIAADVRAILGDLTQRGLLAEAASHV